MTIMPKDTKKKGRKRNFRVVIFGSARISSDEEEYKDIEDLAEHLGERGMDVITGGGPGMMMAASKGHTVGRQRTKNNSKAIGLSIKLPKEQKPNNYLDEEYKFRRFSKRLDTFIHMSNIFVVAPGGFGTILEFFYALQVIQVKQACDTPIILFGDMWPSLVKWIEKWPLKEDYIGKSDMNPIFLAQNCEEVMKVIDKVYDDYQTGVRDFCSNYTKYKI